MSPADRPAQTPRFFPVALGREAVRQGYSVLFTAAMTLITDLAKAQAEGCLDEKLARYGVPSRRVLEMAMGASGIATVSAQAARSMATSFGF